jgi:hypothetical protein
VSSLRSSFLLHGYCSFDSDCEPEAVDDYPLRRCRDANDPKFLIIAMRCQADLPAAPFTSR